MAQIAERIFADGGNVKLLTLGNQGFSRKLNIGNDWTMIRLGMLIAIPTNGTTQSTRTVRMAYGLCNNRVGFEQYTTPHFVGVASPPASPSALTYSTSSSNPYYTVGPQCVRKVGTTVTSSNTGTIQFIAPTTDSSPSQRKGFVFLDITRSYSIQTRTIPSSAVGTEFSYGDMLIAMEDVSGAPVSRGFTMSTGTSNSISGTDEPGELNSLSIYWGSAAYPLEIYGMAVYRIR